MELELIIAGVMVAALVLYALLAGADYGGGVWDLFATGPRATRQRKLISDAIGPIWEANHVWLILVVVLLFTGFPAAFRVMGMALHIPLSLVLVGIVLRGTAFTFRTYDVQRDGVQRRWSLVFSIASILTPLLLGVTIGVLASGSIRVENGVVTSGFVYSWLAPFPIAVGFFALALFAFLAAVYLTLETDERDLQDDFRLRALISGVVVGIMALIVFLLAGDAAPSVRAGITRTSWALGLHASTAVVATITFYALWKRRYQLARIFAAGQVTLILLGWVAAQYPNIIEPDITIFSAAAPKITLQLLVAALVIGTPLLVPSYLYLFKVFKGRTAAATLTTSQSTPATRSPDA